MKLVKILPSALEQYTEIHKQFQKKTLALFLDFDGTLSPIVSQPEEAFLSKSIQSILINLASKHLVAIISGRDLRDIQKRIGIEGIFYAASHGFEILNPQGSKKELPDAKKALPSLDRAKKELKKLLHSYPGAKLESKRFSLAIHYRNLEEAKKLDFKKEVENVCKNYPDLKLSSGKQVLDLGPNLDWNKGKALLWILDQVTQQKSFFPIYIGDDLTDEEAFKAIKNKGLSIIVREEERQTNADYALNHPKEVPLFLESLLKEDGNE